MHEAIKKVAIPVALVLAIVGVVLAWTRSSTNVELLRQAQQAQAELNGSQQRRAIYQGLVQNLVAYSQVQPNIDAVLVPFGFKAAPAQRAGQTQPAPATSRPTTR